MTIANKTGLPDPKVCAVSTSRYGSRTYHSPIGDLPSSTTILKISGLGKEFLINWAANVQSDAWYESCAEVYALGTGGSPTEFADAVKAHVGPVQAQQKIKTEAGDLGTMAHQAIAHWVTTGETLTFDIEPEKSERILWALMAFQDYWRDQGLTLLVDEFGGCERPVWDPELRYGGTLDIPAIKRNGAVRIVDVKTSKAIYDEYHLQVASYIHATRNWIDVEDGVIVRVPKKLDDPQFEVKPLGTLYKKRMLDQEQLMYAFRGFKMAYDMLIAKVPPKD